MDFSQSWRELKEQAAKSMKEHGLISRRIGKQDKIYLEDESSKCMILNNFYLAQAFGKSDRVLVERPECAALFENKRRAEDVIDLKTKKKQARG